MDNYDYDDAIKYENRAFWRIYYICLLSTENILNTFFFKSPLEIRALKLSLFLFNNSCDLAFNCLFYLQGNISDKYHYEGDNLYLFIIINNIMISFISTTASFVFVKLLNLLTNSKDEIVHIFRRNMEEINLKTKRNIYEKLNIIFKCLKIKIIIYIILEFLILLFFFYYITAFCEVYKETQMSWIFDSVKSFFYHFRRNFIFIYSYYIIYSFYSL